MARPLRIEYAGAVYHVTARGNAGAAIFVDDADRLALLDVYGETAGRFGWRCYAYCLMTNHYHFVIETPEPNLSRGMRQLNGVYTQRFNRRHRRTGHVFEGRFKAIVVDRDTYLDELARYVVLNPLRAGMVRRLRDWRWSSYRATAGLVRGPAWLSAGALLDQFAPDRKTAESHYRRFVTEGRTAAPIWDHLQGQIYLGGEAFVKRLRARVSKAQDLGEVPRAQRRARRSLRAYAQSASTVHQAMAQAYRSGDHTMKAIARHFGVHYSTVSRAVRRFEAQAKGNPNA